MMFESIISEHYKENERKLNRKKKKEKKITKDNIFELFNFCSGQFLPDGF